MKTENHSEELQIIEVTRQLIDLMIRKDISGINKILDINFILTHITGYVQSKKEWFLEIESEQMKYYSYTEVKTTVSIRGDEATFVGQNILDAKIWGSRNKWHLQQKMHLEKHEGKWFIMNSVASIF
ncbi:nuclear transport factor 2 family protein [Chryseobacterium ginsengisoli]|uniref:Nuclear transport factor 2 family protein n=1 Tax=Chryseobacterium ginsengisoli TaxID=363853 RepID=A0ABP9M275_9FLAO